jgi:serine/threonine-protein kinase
LGHVLTQSKAVATLAYLSLSPPGRFQRRDRIVGLLWPELYEGELMPGFHLPDCGDFDFWLEEEPRELGERAAAAAWALAEQLEEEEKATLASRWARRAVRYAGTDERVLRRTMTMLDRLGDRVGALKLFTDFAARMRKELDAELSPETRALARSMRAGSG